MKRVRVSRHKLHGLTVTRLMARDGTTCALCGRPLDRKLADGHPSAVTLDHVIPTSHGGGEEFANLRLAHASCNEMRGNSMVDAFRTTGCEP